jgi:hypothetical protein
MQIQDTDGKTLLKVKAEHEKAALQVAQDYRKTYMPKQRIGQRLQMNLNGLKFLVHFTRTGTVVVTDTK